MRVEKVWNKPANEIIGPLHARLASARWPMAIQNKIVRANIRAGGERRGPSGRGSERAGQEASEERASKRMSEPVTGERASQRAITPLGGGPPAQRLPALGPPAD